MSKKKELERMVEAIEEVVYNNGYEFEIMDSLGLAYDLEIEFREHEEEVREYIESNLAEVIEYIIEDLNLSLENTSLREEALKDIKILKNL